MEALDRNTLMAPNIILGGDDEMMDSDFDNTLQQQDDDYDIDLDGGDAYSNAGMDEEMRFDTGDDAAPYDNDDLMLDEGDYQTTTELQGEEIVLLDMQQPENSNEPTFETSVTFGAKEVEFTEVQSEIIAPMVELENLNQFQSLTATTTITTGTEQHEEVVLDTEGPNTVAEDTALPVEAEAVIPEVTTAEKLETQHLSEDNTAKESEPINETYPTREDLEEPLSQADVKNELNDTPSLSAQSVPSPQATPIKIHPVVVQFETNTLSLFNSEFYIDYMGPSDVDGSSEHNTSASEVYPEIPSMYLINDATLCTKGFDEIFASLREMFADDIGEDAELTMEIEELELFLHEDNLLAKSVSLSDLIDLHLRLCKQDSIEKPQPMYITLATQPRFTKRYSELLSAAGEGKGISQVRTYSSVEEYQPSIHNSQQQSAQDTPIALAQTPHDDQESPHSEQQTHENSDNKAHENLPKEGANTPSENQDDFVVIGDNELNGNQEERAEEYVEEAEAEAEAEAEEEEAQLEEEFEEEGVDNYTEAESGQIEDEQEINQGIPGNINNGVEIITNVTTEIVTREISVEEIADDNARDPQSPEEVYEPEGSVFTENQSVTEVTTETVLDEEELLEYEEEEDESYVVGVNNNPEQQGDDSSPLQDHVHSPRALSNEAEGDIGSPTVPHATVEDTHGINESGQDSNTAVAASESADELDDETILQNEIPATDAEEPQHIRVHQFDDEQRQDSDLGNEPVEEYVAAELREPDLQEETFELQEDWNNEEDGVVDEFNSVDAPETNLSAGYWAPHGAYDADGGLESGSPTPAQEIENSKYALFQPGNDDLTTTDSSWYIENGQEYAEYQEEYGEPAEEYEDPVQYEEAEEQHDEAEQESEEASETEEVTEQYLQGVKQSSVNPMSPNGKRLRENDNIDDLDVQHIKRTRSD